MTSLKAVIIIVFLKLNFMLLGQCSCAGSYIGDWDVSGVQQGVPTGIVSVRAGWMVNFENLIPNASYRVSTCGAQYNSELTLFNSDCSVIGYSTNDPSGTCFYYNRGVLTFTAPSNGIIRVKVNTYNCGTSDNSYVPLVLTLLSLPSCSPSASISTANTSICSGELVSFSSSVSNAGTNPIYNWSVNGLSTGIATSQFSSNSLNQGDIVSCEITTSTGCSNVTSVMSNTIQIQQVNLSISPQFTQVPPICIGDNVQPLPTSSINSISGSWSPVLNNTSTTTYTFTPNVGECASNATMVISVNTPSTPSFTQVTPICNGESLSALPLTSNNGVAGTWLPSLNNTSTITYTFTPSAGQCALTNTMTIEVFANPNVSIDNVSNTLQATTGMNDYTWYLDGNVISGATSSSLAPSSNGIYSVEVVDNNGCFGYNSFNYNNALIADWKIEEFSVNPNPSADVFKIKFKDSQPRTVMLFNNQGKILFKESCSTEKMLLNLENYPSGAYYLQVNTDQFPLQKMLIKF